MNESNLFQGITVYISGEPDKKVLELLKNGKGQMSKFTMEKATMVLCGRNYEEAHIQEARELYEIPAVSENWVLASSKMGKLACIKAYYPTLQGKLFHGCLFTMTQIDAQDRLKLYAMITFHGGSVQKVLDNKVTHLLSGGAQSVALKVAGLVKMTIVTPDWVIECLKHKKLVEPEGFHPNLLISPTKQKVTLMATSGDPKASPSLIRNQLQQSVRPARPMVVQMQHTPQQINEIIQSQIQQQQMQEQAKLRAAQAAANQNQTNVPDSGGQNVLQVNQKIQQNLPQISAANSTPTTIQQFNAPVSVTQINPNPSVAVNSAPSTIQQFTTNPTPAISTPNTIQQNAQMTISSVQQPPQLTQNPQQQQPMQMPQPQQQQQQPGNNQVNIQQRQIAIQQQIEANARNQKIQLISQQLQQSTQNQQQLIAQQQQMKQFQSNQMIPQPQQFVQQGGNVIQQGGNVIQQQQQHGQQFGNQTMKQILTTNPQQNQQFIINQNPSQNIKTINPQQQQNIIQIIQQGQQILQIHPDGSQTIQKNVNQPQLQQQQIQINQNMPNPPNVSIQSAQMGQNVGGGLQQVPSAPPTLHPQQPPQQQQQIQNQGGRQNIVIINQLQNAQNVNQMGQRFQNPQGQFQKTQIGAQQIIQQKILANNEGLSQSSSQIIQVHQTTLPGGQIGSAQGQQNVEAILLEQKMQHTGNVVHVQQTNQPNTQGLTQAQAVQQIAQQLQSGTAEIISQQNVPQVNTQNMNVVTQATPGVQTPTTPGGQQWIPQSPTQQPPQTPPIVQQTVVQQHIITTNQVAPGQAQGQQFIRATGPRLSGQIYLDAQSTMQLQRMDQAQKQEYLEQLHIKQQQQQQRGVMFQQRPVAPNAVPGPRTQHIVIRSQVPPGLTPQQQLQWLNSQRRQILIRQPNQVGMTPLPNQHANITQIQIDPNATQQQQQQQLQRQQQFQRFQHIQQQNTVKMQGNVQTPVSPRGPGFQEGVSMEGVPQAQLSQDGNGVSSSKTKTALANMLSNRLGGNNGNVVPLADNPGVVEQSAAGTLRMMTAQHNAALNVQGVVRNPQELIVLQNQQQQPQMTPGQSIVQPHPQIQQRRTLGNITNAPGANVAVPSSPVIQMAPGQVIMPQSPSTNIKSQPPFSPGRAPQMRPQFYGHNPNLKLPTELFLLGCHFLIVEYDETNLDDLDDWRKSIKHHGGEIETCYNLKVTHVLCRTQKHGIVMQAIRDNKRCVTAYWLNDIILKKQVIPPWQAIHFPSSAVFGPLRPGMKHVITIMGFENDERERVKRMIEESGAKLTTYLNRQNTVVVCKRLDQTNKKYLHAKEYNIAMVNVVWLSDLLLGNTSLISQYESPKYQQYNLPQPLRIDHTILPQLMNAWKAPINLTQEAHERLKRHQMEPPIKRAKKMRTIPFLETISDEIVCVRQPDAHQIPIVMFSNVDNIEGLSRAVVILGGRVTNDRNEMTHLIMTKPNRTMKFMYALCRAKYILTSSWLEESAKTGYFQNEENFWIKDLGKCDVPAIVKSPFRSRLFEDRVFFITPSVTPAPSYLRWLIEQSGGKWEHNRRSVMKIHELNQQSPNSYIVVSCPEDLHLLGFKHYVCFVCTSEFVLQSIMTQSIDFLKSELQLTR